MNRTVVSSFAILKINSEQLGQDYLTNFLPFVIDSALSLDDDVVSLPKLKEKIQQKHGIDFPLNPLKRLLRKATRNGYFRRTDGALYRIPEKCCELHFEETLEAVDTTFGELFSELATFAREVLSVEWNDEDAEQALLAFVEEDGLDFLYGTTDRRVRVEPPPSTATDYVVGRFVAEAMDHREDSIEKILTLIKGHLLKSALYLPGPGPTQARFSGVRVYLDTSLLVFAAGFAGDDRKAPREELIHLLHDHGARLYCFRQTLEEVRGILYAAAARMKRGEAAQSYGPVIDHFVLSGLTSTDVDYLVARLPTHIQSMGIRIEEKPPYRKPYNVDESGLERHLKKKIGYRNPSALVHDVDCISGVARLRRGREPYTLENCHALFVSTNSALARAARSFFHTEYSPGMIPLCLTDEALGSLLWLKNPTKAPELPKRRLIVDSFAAMEPPEGLWTKYLAEIARLEASGSVSAEDYYVLRYSASVRPALMDATRGDPSAFTEGTVAEILEVAKEHARAELEESLQIEEDRRSAAEEALGVARRSKVDTLQQVERFADRVARTVTVAATAAVFVIIIVPAMYSFPWSLPSPSADSVRYALSVGLMIFFVLMLLNVMFGTVVKNLAKKLGDAVGRKILLRLVKWLHL